MTPSTSPWRHQRPCGDGAAVWSGLGPTGISSTVSWSGPGSGPRLGPGGSVLVVCTTPATLVDRLSYSASTFTACGAGPGHGSYQHTSQVTKSHSQVTMSHSHIGCVERAVHCSGHTTAPGSSTVWHAPPPRQSLN